MANNTTLRDGNGALFTAESVDIGSGVQRTSTAANLRVGNTDVAAGNPIPIAESAGTPITGASMPAGGVGLTGWLSAIWSKLASTVSTALGTAQRVVLVDPTTGNGSLVQAFHNSDNQALGATSYGLMTGGVDQLLNAAGNLDRKRAVAGDGMAVTGLAAEVPMLWNGATYDRAPGTAASGMKVSDVQSAPVAGVTAIVPSDSASVTAGRGLGVIATAAGNVIVGFADASTITVPVASGYQQFPFAVTKLMATGTTATATYYILK
jgi:hypothetical protein